jgi:hypothetical protein
MPKPKVLAKRKRSSRESASRGGSIALKNPPRKRSAGKSSTAQRTSKTAIKTTSRSIYSVHPGIAMVQRWVAELNVKTGRTLDEWIKHIKHAGPPVEKECRDWLKSMYSLGTNTAGWLAENAFGDSQKLAEDTPEGYLAAAPQYVEQMYAGVKEALKPIHDEIIKVAQQLGDDVRICPCKTIVPLYRRHVFAQIKPATNKRLDLGFALGEEPFTARLHDTGGLAKKDRITHSVALASLADFDLQVKRWLKQAYERDA